MCGISDTGYYRCYWTREGLYHIWTAGQRVDPTRESPFVWRELGPGMQSEKETIMDYTAWHPGQPDFAPPSYAQSCVNIFTKTRRWNDMACNTKLCSICEIDM